MRAGEPGRQGRRPPQVEPSATARVQRSRALRPAPRRPLSSFLWMYLSEVGNALRPAEAVPAVRGEVRQLNRRTWPPRTFVLAARRHLHRRCWPQLLALHSCHAVGWFGPGGAHVRRARRAR